MLLSEIASAHAIAADIELRVKRYTSRLTPLMLAAAKGDVFPYSGPFIVASAKDGTDDRALHGADPERQNPP